MSEPDGTLTAEGSGDTVGEARWAALRELERRVGGTVDPATVEIVVVSEGERGLLGVGREPARVLARLTATEVAAQAPAAVPAAPVAPAAPAPDLGAPASAAFRVVSLIAASLGPEYRVDASEDDARGIVLDIAGGDPGPVIGRHGATIDAIEHLASAVAFPPGAERVPLAVDAQGYRARRDRRLRELAEQAATQAIAEAAPMELDPMSAAERKVVHLALAEREDVETSSDGREPERFVVVWPRGTRPPGAGA
jgi:spoIIIJ-associated protein